MTLYELYSPSCVPCKMLKPRLEDLKKEYPDLKIEYFNLMDYISRPLEEVKEDKSIPEALKSAVDSIKGTPHLVLVGDNGEILLNEHGGFNILGKVKEFLK